MEESKEEKKQRKRNGKSRRSTHHPWDEVSLPGAGTNPNEQQQTLFEVINNNKQIQQQPQAEATTKTTASDSETLGDSSADNAGARFEAPSIQIDTSRLTDAILSDDLVSNSNSNSDGETTKQIPKPTGVPSFVIEDEEEEESEVKVNASDREATKKPTTSTTPTTTITSAPPSPAIDRQGSRTSTTTDDQGHVLDIESHLIETFDEYHTEDDSVGINELPPQQDELLVGSSKVETDANVRTVIEVQPAGVISKKPIEILVQAGQVQHYISEADTEAGAEVVIDSRNEPPSEAIKETAERLVNEIEREVLEAFKNKELNAEADAETEQNRDIIAKETKVVEAEESNAQAQQQEKTEPLLPEDDISNTLTQKVDAQLSEVTSILKSKTKSAVADSLKVGIDRTLQNELKIVNVPSPKTQTDVEERKLFLDSLPQIDSNAEAQKLADDCKREYYQSLKKYLIDSNADRPPVPLQTYRWEDLKRAKERGGYPWTHLYKRPLGPDEEPEVLLLLRKSQEIRFTSESPKSLKKVRIDEQVIVKQPQRYIQELSEGEEDYPLSAPEPDDEETHSLRSESVSCVSDSILATGKPRKPTRLEKIRGYLRRRKGGRWRTNEDAQSLPCASTSSSRRHSQEHLEVERQSLQSAATAQSQLLQPQKLANGNHTTEQKHCYPIMKKLKSMADRQKKRLNIKRIHLGKDEKIVLGEETKILKLKNSPKAERGEIPHFIEKQDSDDVIEIMELDESPSRKRRDDDMELEVEVEAAAETAQEDYAKQADTSLAAGGGVIVPDEIIELTELTKSEGQAPRVEHVKQQESEVSAVTTTTTVVETSASSAAPPKKAPRLRREHVYEEIATEAYPNATAANITTTTAADSNAANADASTLLELAAVEALKQSLAKQNNLTLQHIEQGAKALPLERMGSSEEEQITATTNKSNNSAERPSVSLLAPLSSIDSASSDEDRNRTQLSPVTEESDAASGVLDDNSNLRVISDFEPPLDLKPAIKKEASPAPSDKKVTFSHVEDEAEPHREDIELPLEVQEAAMAEAANRRKLTSLSDHEYEVIAAPLSISSYAENVSANALQQQQQPSHAFENSELTRNIERLHEEINIKEAAAFQNELEERYFSSAATRPRTDSRTDYEIHTSQVDSSALEELPLQPENRKKGFMASAQDRTRKMQAGLRNQAGKIKTKLRTPATATTTTTTTKKATPTAAGSPKARERRRFKAPEFSKLKMPELKRPDMTRLKEFKRPEFTKFNKPDMSKFKLPEKFPTLKLKRSRSFKENEADEEDAEMAESTVEQHTDGKSPAQPQAQKKMFDFNFGTYPRAFRKKKKPLEPLEAESIDTGTGTEGLSVIPSTETQPSVESSSSPQGDRGPGPVRSRWADKFSDVSYNDSEGSRYRRYGSELESFERESSLERRMKDDLDDNDDDLRRETGSESTQEMGILGRGVTDTKQFAEFDEENRAIHEISKMRASEFRRRPIVHQDSDLRSEDSKEVEGWTEKEIEKNELLRKAELEAEASYLKYIADDASGATGVAEPAHETQSVASSGKKVIMEEIDDDEFFLRKRGISEDNIELRQYISEQIREGYEDKPFNTLGHVGQTSEQQLEPPPKPKRLNRSYRSRDNSQELEFQRHSGDYGDDLSMSQNGSDYYGGAPKRPLRKGRSRSKYSVDSQDFAAASTENESQLRRHEHYFDDDEEYLRPPRATARGGSELEMNDLDMVGVGKQIFAAEAGNVKDGAATVAPPKVPTRRRKRDAMRDNSLDSKDSYMNGFGGRSVSNTRLQPNEDVIVYRTEHEYPVPLAATEKFTPTLEERKSRSINRFADDDDDCDYDDRTSRGAESMLSFDNRNEMQQQQADNKDKFVIDMIENDGYAVVRKDNLPKPTPPARRKKFSRSPGERFTSTPATSSTPPPARPPPPRAYTPSTPVLSVERVAVAPPRRKSITSLDVPAAEAAAAPQILEEDDYEEPGALQPERPESPRNLQSGEIVNKMKFRPLPAPPRPPREKRQRVDSRSSASAFVSLQTEQERERDTGDERIASSSTADSYEPTDVDLDEEGAMRLPEVEVSTQTDPLPDDFECEEFEITDDMKIIEPRINNLRKTLDELLKEEELRVKNAEEATPPLTEEEQLARGLQRFRDANQRSMSERSKASSQAGSKTQSRPQTPSSAVVIERRVSTPIPSQQQQQQQQSENMLEASLIVRPIDDLELEEEALRREGLLTDSSQYSKSDVEAATSHDEDEVEEETQSKRATVSDYSMGPSSDELDAALDELRAQQAKRNYEEERVGKSDVAEMSEYEFDEKHSDEDVLDGKYSEYTSEEATSVKAEETADEAEEREDTVAYQTESEEIANMYALSEDDRAENLSESREKLSEIGKYSEDEREQEREEKLDWQRSRLSSEHKESLEEAKVPEEPPLPPPRRKSTTAADVLPPPSLSLAEHTTKELTPLPERQLQPPQTQTQMSPQLPTHLVDLEVERLRVHALQAGQIMVSQLHGRQISADELECKSGNLIVQNIALPEGFIEDIVERVRTTTERGQLLAAAETQTSLQASREGLLGEEPTAVQEVVAVPPPKPPRQRDLDAAKRAVDSAADEIALQQLRNYDEETQTDPVTAYPATNSVPPPVYTITTEYLQSMPPPPPSMGFYNLPHGDEQQQPYAASSSGGVVEGGNTATLTRRRLHQHQHQHRHHHHSHHHHRRHRHCESSCSECDLSGDGGDDDEAAVAEEETRSHSSRSRRSRSSTRPPAAAEHQPQTVAKAGQQFISACSLSIVNMINRLTAAIRGADGEPDKNMEAQIRQIPTIVALFILVSFTLIVYLLSGKNVHTHHWDFFNLPGNGHGPRPT